MTPDDAIWRRRAVTLCPRLWAYAYPPRTPSRLWAFRLWAFVMHLHRRLWLLGVRI